eukprot:TRINITY_DN7156_c0_g1_i1.p1 TRINITY_DN7156_c0_g1~~TRINITY_DN7156_c0_g1_i1.p1  ORF type:complete len:1839 (+),score=402.85 TRINITY_DN7156_c0_g1_i1:709-5517(+)
MIAGGDGKSDLFEREKRELFTPASRLILCFMAALQKVPQGIDIEKCRRILEESWDNGPDQVWSILNFVWGVFRKDDISKAVDKGVWSYLCSLVDNLHTGQIFHPYYFSSVLNDLFTAFVTFYQQQILDLKKKAEVGVVRVGFLAPVETSDSSFKDMLRFVSLLYEGLPDLCKAFWDNRSPFKHFLRIVGENVQPHLSGLYLRMIASLASGDVNAHQAFLYLVNHQSRLNLNYLFESLQRYVADFQSLLRQSDFPGGPPQAPRSRKLDPIELEVMTAIVYFVRRVIENSKEVYHVMMANTSWQFFETLFKLLTCPVPTSLKAEIVHAISAFAAYPEMTPKIWTHLECSQIIPTTAPKSISGSVGLKHEIHSSEAREREYPYLEAFLELLEKLLKNGGIPEELGIQHRAPGIQAYVDFVVDEVLLRFINRDYKDEASKWRIGSLGLSILFVLLQLYTPSVDDFEHKSIIIHDKTEYIPKPPGFGLIVYLLSEERSDLRQQLLNAAARGIEAMRDPERTSKVVETTVQRVFQVIESVLLKQSTVLNFNRNANAPFRLQAFEKFLLRNKGENIRLLIDPIMAEEDPPSIVMLSLNILHLLSQAEGIPRHLIAILNNTQDSLRLMYGIVNLLDAPPQDSAIEEEDAFLPEPETNLRAAVMKLLIDCVKQPEANLTHLLLGFNMTALHKSDLQNNKQHPLNTILGYLQRPEFHTEQPELAVQCYELIYRLCSSSATSDTTFRYLKSHTSTFFHHQLQQLHIRPDERWAGEELTTQLEWRAWFLKIVALEIYREKDHRSSVQSILEVLYSKVEEDRHFLSDVEDQNRDQRMVMHSLLDALDIKLETPSQLGQIDELTAELLRLSDVHSCTTEDEYGFKITDVKKLHKNMLVANAKLARRQGAAPRSSIENVLRKCVEWNTFYALFRALCNFFKAWKETLSSTLLFSFGILNTEKGTGEIVLYTLLEELLLKLNREDVQNPLQGLLASGVLLLMKKLREQKYQQYSQTIQRDNIISGGNYLPISQLHAILSRVVSRLLMEDTTVSTRGNLYAALLNYLQFTHRPFLHMPKDESIDKARKLAIANEIHNQWVKLEHGNQAILSGAGERLVQILAMDADNNTKIIQAVAFSLIDWLVRYDGSGKWMQNIIIRHGYLRNYLIAMESGGFLNPDGAEDIYVHEARMSMFISLAEVPHGAKAIVDNGVISLLSDCDFIDQRPECTAADIAKWAEVVENYHELLYPVLQLLAVCLNTLPGKTDVADQVIDFILKHHELFSSILRDRTAVITLSSLQQIEVITRIFYLLTPFWERVSYKVPQLNAFQNMLLNLLAKYSVPERWLSLVKPLTRYERGLHTEAQVFSKQTPFMNDIYALTWQIWRNLVSFCRAIALPVLSRNPNQVGVEHSQVLFTSSLVNVSSDKEDIPTLSGDHRSLSLGTLINFLKNTKSYLDEALIEYEDGAQKLANLNDVLKDIPSMEQLAAEENISRDNSEQLRKLTQKKLSQLQVERTTNKNNLYYVIENVLLLIWSHLFQFLKTRQADTNTILASPTKKKDIHSQISAMTEDDRQRLRMKASEVLVEQLTKLEDLDEVRQPNIISILVKKLRELLNHDVKK